MRVFREPRFDAKVDLDAHLRLLSPAATCKGLFFTHFFDLAKRVISPDDLLRRAGLPERRHLVFHDYPMADQLRLIVGTAQVLLPSLPLGEGLRRVGRTAYDGLLGSHAGRVVFGVLGLDLPQILTYGPRAISLVTSFKGVSTERVGERTFHVYYRDMPAFLETYHVGALEGVLEKCGARGRVRTDVVDLANAVHEVTWTP